MLRASEFQLLFEEDVVQASAGVAAGYFDKDSLGTLLDGEDGRAAKMITLGAPNDNGPRHRGLIIEPMLDSAQAADGVTVTLGVFLINQILNRSTGKLQGYRIEKISSVVCTASTGTVTKALCGGAASGSYRLCDTIVPTATALGTALGSAYEPALSAYSPEDDTQGQIIIPDCAGAYGVIIDPVATGDGFNAMVRKVT